MPMISLIQLGCSQFGVKGDPLLAVHAWDGEGGGVAICQPKQESLQTLFLI